MRTVWQGFIAVLVLGGLSFTVLSLARPNDNGEFGFTLRRISNAQSIVVTVEPGGAAADAGIRKGDRIFPARDPAQRISVTTPEPGDRIVVRVNDPNSAPVVVIARAGTQNVPAAAIAALVLTHLAFLFMGGLIAFRRPDDPAARSLATFLACFGVAMTLSTDLAQFSSTLGRFAAYLFVEAMFFVGAIAVLSFACRFPERAAGGWRLVIARSVVPLGVAGVLLSMTRLVLYYFTDFPWEHRSLLLLPYVLLYNFVLALAFASFIGAYRAMDGFDRIRMRWVLGTFGFGFSGLVVYFVMVSTGLNNPALDVVTFTIACIPIGLAYVILRHRIIDIGFVINRAVVYASVSLIVVGTFIVFEWLLAHVVEQRSNASAFLQIAGALALGLSVRLIHERVDRYVDDFFFRERHLAEAAIRRFAHEAALITDPDDLVIKTIEITQRNARLTGVAFYARREDGYVPIRATFGASAIDENDYAVLQMRTWHESVDLHDSRTALQGEIVFPMMVRGMLAGFLLCGAKTTHESLAPDERAALALLARDAGIALDSLRVRIIERELALLAREGGLPATLRDRLAKLGATSGEGIAF